jgi:hypothetical protein
MPMVWLIIPSLSLVLIILTCLFSPVFAVLSALSCLFCPVFSVLYVFSFLFQSSSSLLAVFSWLSYLDSHSVSVLTIFNYLSSWPCPVFPVLLVLLVVLLCLSCLYCSALDLSFHHYFFCPALIFCSEYYLIQTFIKLHLCPVYSVLLYILFCPPFFLPITPVLPFLSLFSWTTFTLLYTVIIACPASCSKVFLLSTPVLSLAVRPVSCPVSCPVCHNWSILLRSSIQTHSSIL